MTPEVTLDIMKCEATRNFLTTDTYFKAFCNWLPLKNGYNSWITVAVYSDLLVCSGRSYKGHAKVKCKSFSFSSTLAVPDGVRVDINYHGTEVIDLVEHLNLHLDNVMKKVKIDINVALFIHFQQRLNVDDVKEYLKPAFGNTYKSPNFMVEYDYITCDWLQAPHIKSTL